MYQLNILQRFYNHKIICDCPLIALILHLRLVSISYMSLSTVKIKSLTFICVFPDSFNSLLKLVARYNILWFRSTQYFHWPSWLPFTINNFIINIKYLSSHQKKEHFNSYIYLEHSGLYYIFRSIISFDSNQDSSRYDGNITLFSK